MQHAFATSPADSSPAAVPAHDASLAQLVSVLAEHYVPMARPASVDLCIADPQPVVFRFTLADTVTAIHVDIDASAASGHAARSLARGVVGSSPDASCAHNARCAPSPQNAPSAPSARITMSAAAFAQMLASPTRFDPRSAELAALGGVRIEGSSRLAAYWLQLLKRPTPEGAAALERARLKQVRAPHTIDCIDAATTHDWPQRIAAAVKAGTPLHVQAMLDWPEAQWPLERWLERDGDTVLRNDPRDGRAQTLAAFIAALDHSHHTGGPAAPDTVYTGGTPLPRAWDARFRLPRLPAAWFGPAQLWFGQRSDGVPVTQLHCDLENSFLAQLHGHKRVRLYAPHEASNVYALDAFNTYRPCRVDAGAPDLTRFPRFASARAVDVTIGPGDLLVIPTGWFHCVWTDGATLSISRFANDAVFDAHDASRRESRDLAQRPGALSATSASSAASTAAASF